ncbi:MAG TPA: serine hydrolase domain-containing protein, partial [Acidobacteriaceae bacterium]
TKVYTAALVMRLVQDGKISLDAPVREYLPDFRLKQDDVVDKITVWHLLTHTSGIDGDYFADFGPGADPKGPHMTAVKFWTC